MIRVLTTLAAVVALAVSATPAFAVRRRHVEHTAGGLFAAYKPADATRRPYPLSELPRPRTAPARPIK